MNTVYSCTQNQASDYDLEPVVYCVNCLSLNIKHDDTLDIDYCECGCTDVSSTSVEIWEEKYKKKYGKKFVENTRDITKSPIFQMSVGELMVKLSSSSKWQTVIKEMYGKLPKGLSKADTILVFFDKLLKENKLKALRTLLYNMKI